ncbi:SPFH domain-containing protein [bacterium]|nr:SPFH domain-containing protein [bacterium]MCI0604553.1 SPFH domain-containing protein [bacterium]
MHWILLALFVILLLRTFRVVRPTERGLILRLGKSTKRVVGPGLIAILPFVDRIRRVSIEPLSLSLPIQSAITRDEIPIQLQASLDAEVKNPRLALIGARDWRVHLISQLQLLMKERLEELDFDHLDSSFPKWIQSIRREIDAAANVLGVQITGLSISNLSPRSRPE